MKKKKKKKKKKTYQHLLILTNPDPLAFNRLQILQPTEHFMVDLKDGLDAKHGSFFDGEWLILQRIESPGLGQVNCDVRSTIDLERQGFDDAFSRILGIAHRFARVKAQRGLPSVKGFVVLIWARTCYYYYYYFIGG